MVGSGIYNYVNILDKAADASWLRNEVISNNIANATTPGYKRQDVQFESYLMTALAGENSLDEAVGDIDLSHITATTYTEYSGLSYRMDGNNPVICPPVSRAANASPLGEGAKGLSHFPSGVNIYKTNREDVSRKIHPL